MKNRGADILLQEIMLATLSGPAQGVDYSPKSMRWVRPDVLKLKIANRIGVASLMSEARRNLHHVQAQAAQGSLR